MSAFSSSIFRLCSLVIPAVAALVQVTSAAGQDLRNVAVVEGCSKTFHAANAVERNSGGSRDNQSSAWKQKSTRGWTASVTPGGPRQIQLVSATSTEEPKTSPSPAVSTSAARTSRRPAGSTTSGKSASPVTAWRAETVSAATDFPPVPDPRPLTATEKFKRALAEQRRTLEAQAARNESQDSSLNMQTPVEKPKKSPGLTATVDSDLQSDDPLKREMAERFQRLKEKLAKLKLRVQNAENPGDLQSHDSSGDLSHGNASNSPATPNQPAGDSASEHSVEPHDVAGMPEENAVSPEPHSSNEDTHSPDDSHSKSPAAHSDHPQHSDHAEPSEEHSAEHDPAQSHAADETEHGDSKHPATTHSQSSVPNAEHPHGEEIENGSHASAETSGAEPHAVFSDKAVVEGPIDRIGLANNLYAVGEFRLAMEMYEHVEKKELSPEQQIWSEYQAANCLRRIGKNGEASNRYRRLAGMAEAGWLSDQSRWWLEVLEQVRQLEKSLDSDSDSAKTSESVIHPTTNTKASAHAAPHQPATPTDDAHNGRLNTTKEHSHGEHSE